MTSDTGRSARREIGLLRLAAQRIAGPGLIGPTEAVRWLTAVQAQDLPGAVTSVALRTASRSRKEVEAALDAGEVVRSWPMRGTLHLVVAEDLPWLVELLAPRTVAAAAGRRAGLGLDTTTLHRARDLAGEALAGGRRLRREELFAVWQAGGVPTTGQRGYHLLGHLAQIGVVCLGPMRDGEQQVVLVDEWVPRARRLEREEALGELAERYFRSHGPATVKDLARWANLTMADARAGLAIAGSRLATLAVDGVDYRLDPETAERLAGDRLFGRRQARGLFLLPGFDEFVLGYGDRGAVLPAKFADRIVPGGNGVFQPTVVHDGQIVGTWKHTGRGAARSVAASPFEALPDRVTAAISKVYASLPS